MPWHTIFNLLTCFLDLLNLPRGRHGRRRRGRRSPRRQRQRPVEGVLHTCHGGHGLACFCRGLRGTASLCVRRRGFGRRRGRVRLDRGSERLCRRGNVTGGSRRIRRGLRILGLPRVLRIHNERGLCRRSRRRTRGIGLLPKHGIVPQAVTLALYTISADWTRLVTLANCNRMSASLEIHCNNSPESATIARWRVSWADTAYQSGMELRAWLSDKLCCTRTASNFHNHHVLLQGRKNKLTFIRRFRHVRQPVFVLRLISRCCCCCLVRGVLCSW